MAQEPGFADDIVQDKLPVHSEPPRDRFLPWHRVKKEFIRRHQWNKLAIRMIKRYWDQQLQSEENEWGQDEDGNQDQDQGFAKLDRPLQLLVLPGDDLLDLRALCRDVDGLGCYIRYLGFNEGQGSDQQGTRVHIANNAVTSLPRVDKNSRVLHDRFEVIALDDSQAYRYLKQYGPYHIVNLDLCGSMFPNTTKDSAEYYNALQRLLGYQFEHQRSAWLLFITTVVEPGVADYDKMKRLCQPASDNSRNHQDFAEQMKKMFPENFIQAEDFSLDLSVLGKDQMVQLFGLALGKWLLALCQAAKPQWTIAMRQSYRYTVNKHKGSVMLSLAFALTPNIAPPVDKTGMTSLNLQTRKFPDERECAIRLIGSVSGIQDVDSILGADHKLNAEMRDAHADLLEAAGYDRKAYIKWVEGGEVTR